MEKISKTTGVHIQESNSKKIADTKNDTITVEYSTDMFTGVLDALLADWQRVTKDFFS